MTELLFMDNSYIRKCNAIVIETKNIDENILVRLNRTIFYPKGGGLLSDTGELIKATAENDEIFKVREVYKYKEEVYHVVDKDGLKKGDSIACSLDWEKRYTMMKYHTAAHVLASRFYNRGAKITGNQITPEKARLDFNLPEFDRYEMEKTINEANNYFGQDINVKIFYLGRDKALNKPELIKLAGATPPEIDPLRIVQIGSGSNLIDIQADGGPHVKNLNEIPQIEIIKMKNKGKGNKRVYFKFK